MKKKCDNHQVLPILSTIFPDISDLNDLLNKALDLSYESVLLIELKTGRILYANHTASSALGYDREELMGYKTIFDIDTKMTIELWEQHRVSLREHRNIIMESFHSTKAGHLYPIKINANYCEKKGYEYNLAMIRNIAMDQEYETFFHISRDGIAVVDLTTKFMKFNDIYLQMTGYTREELLAKTCIELSAPEDLERSKDVLHILLEKGNVDNFEKRCVVKDGKIITVSMSFALLPDRERILVSAKDITEQKYAENKLNHMAYHDPLIGLPNRVAAKNLFESFVSSSGLHNHTVALLYIDLDGFKAINDTLGHEMGDKVLQRVAERIRSITRTNDVLCRQGGDEFLLILPSIRNIGAINGYLERLMGVFKTSLEIEDHDLSVGASIGIALYPQHGENFETLLQHADMAMYQAKSNGKNSYSFYSRQQNRQLLGQYKLQNDIRKALDRQEFILNYQPKIDLKTRQIVGVEALIRWNHPKQGRISPIDFIPIAENTGLIIPMGEWIIHEACRQAAQWHAKGLKLNMAVNISGIQFKRGNLDQMISNVLVKSGLPPHYLELEFTESVMMHDADQTMKKIHDIKNLGVVLSIDDFGTGYSSLAYLKRFAVDKLKIDQSFIRDLALNTEDAVIVDTIIQMAKNLNLRTIAEGVESAEALNALEVCGCDEVQGYHFAKPMGKDELEQYCRDSVA